MNQPAILINCFEVPAGREDAFFTLWLEVNRYMRTRPGYRSHSLHKSLAPDAVHRFVNIAAWDSAAALGAAHDGHFRALVSAPQWREFPSTPGVYDTVHTGDAQTGDVQAPAAEPAVSST